MYILTPIAHKSQNWMFFFDAKKTPAIFAEAPGGCQDLGSHGAQELRGARGAPDGGGAAVPELGGVPWTSR